MNILSSYEMFVVPSFVSGAYGQLYVCTQGFLVCGSGIGPEAVHGIPTAQGETGYQMLKPTALMSNWLST